MDGRYTAFTVGSVLCDNYQHFKAIVKLTLGQGAVIRYGKTQWS